MDRAAATTPLEIVRGYHEATKHHPHRYARSLGYMDWATQPNPFRQYEGTERIALDHPEETPRPRYDDLFEPGALSPMPLDRAFISRVFYMSLALSAWKQASGTLPWSLRVNPSSGNLHPTEGYLIAGPVEGLSDVPGVYHYQPFLHALERRRTLTGRQWQALHKEMPNHAIFLGLSSIHWRESWKYGERAYRYCQHDAGHAFAAVAIAAAACGWRARLIDHAADDELAVLLGIHEQKGTEAEHVDGLMLMQPGTVDEAPGGLTLAQDLRQDLLTSPPAGVANKLSDEHHHWPVIDEVSDVCLRNGISTIHLSSAHEHSGRTPNRLTPPREAGAFRIIRQRRSAVAMDGRTRMPASVFFDILGRVMPTQGALPFSSLPWRPCVSLALFVHRVDEVQPGLYLLVRHPEHETSLRSAIRNDLRWKRPGGCPDDLPLYLLTPGNLQRAAGFICCQQSIAADGVFAVGMLAEFDSSLETHGASFYPRLFWETGVIGQVLYLEAEAAGIRSTGIGCFHDDQMHETLGMRDRSWQSLYHFTVGGPVHDKRLKTIPPYAHLEGWRAADVDIAMT